MDNLPYQDVDVQQQPHQSTWLQQLTKGLKDPSGEGGRWIVLHAGSANGFVRNGLLVFQSKKTGDCHEKIDSARFEKWFMEQLLPNIMPNNIIIVDNPPYHSVKVEKVNNTYITCYSLFVII